MQHGESNFNLEGKIGGDADISPRGEMYAKALPDLVQLPFHLPFTVARLLTENLPR